MPVAPAPPRALGAPEVYVGDDICINFDGRSFWLRTGIGNITMSMSTMASINAYVRMVTGASDDEHNVYCEETKKHHRAVLLRELTLDEIYKGLK